MGQICGILAIEAAELSQQFSFGIGSGSLPVMPWITRI